MGNMTGVNILVKDAIVIANECLARINQYRMTRLNKLMLEEEAYKKEVEEMNGFLRWLNADIIDKKFLRFNLRRLNIPLAFKANERLANDILLACDVSGSPWLYISAQDLGFLTEGG